MSQDSSLHPLEVSCETVHQKLEAGEDILLVDCREQAEYDTVSIDSAVLLPMSEIQARLGELESQRDKEIVIHCHHGGRSMQVTAWLTQQGFANVKSMAGGIDRWAEVINPELPRY
ncbi:rhodanese-like domain-containing protein [Thalassoroseus pseudoceratinae]|uniref:rhodanese-like domain-containing protein n=1 Tax=Thalassoroseus pseudoceratinae TaxID=2713176 RepID=UPI0014238814|nr:rhodanese-like domain-containing protein [Thalassoroseus pseudoceratinae]